jgi:signal transduction histidine kinase
LSEKILAEALLADYKTENHLLRARRNRIACLIGLIFMPMGALFDLLYTPEQFWEFLSIRLLVSGIMLALYVCQRLNASGDKSQIIAVALVLVLNSSFCVLMFLSDGVMTRYHTIISLMLLGSGLLMACTLAETFLISLSTLLLYASSAYLHNIYIDPSGDWAQLFNNLYFIFLSGVLGGASSHFYTNARLNDFNLRRQLDRRNRELERLDRLKSRFFANISHELRTPLTLILAPLQDLLQHASAFDGKINALVKTAHTNALRLLRLVNDLLDVIKLEEGKMKHQDEPIEIGKFLAAMVDSMRHLAESNRIKLVKRLAGGSVIIADSYLLERIFINLIGNAIKFTQAGGVIDVIEEADPDRVVIKISDTGIGINQTDLPYIFDRFHQAGNSSTHRAQGTGLGLALVKELTEQMRGDISVASELGKGTTMRLSFPVSRRLDGAGSGLESRPAGHVQPVMQPITENTARVTHKPVLSPPEPVVPAGDGPLVMVVDDEPDMRNYLMDAMDKSYRVVEAVDGEQALRLARNHKPDLILLDVMIPKHDGLEVCRRLKHDDETRHIKIMLLTARIDEGAKIEALNNGADDFLTKPFSKVEVQIRLRNLLQTARLENALRLQNKELKATLAALRQTQAQLINSEKINALGRLTAGLLHEINNPLNYSLTALQFIKHEQLYAASDTLRDTFHDIDEGLNRIKTIIGELQVFAHPAEANKQEPFHFNEALANAIRFAAKDIGDIRIQRKLWHDDEIYGSRGSIVQVLINLFSNASKAIAEVRAQRQGEITVTTERRGDRLHITMRDNGTGIETNAMKNIFDPFYTSRDVGEGMGLGLSICHTIVRNHGGKLTVNSEFGKWTEFCLDLPCASAGARTEDEIHLHAAE